MKARPPIFVVFAFVLLSPPFVSAQGAHPNFDAPVIFADSYHKADLVLDLDNDTYIDAVGVGWTPTDGEWTITGWHNNGTGVLDIAWTITDSGPYDGLTSYHMSAAAAADINGDGLVDFACHINNSIVIYSSTGAGAPILKQKWVNLQPPERLAFEDINNDGKPDLIEISLYALTTYLNIGSAASPFVYVSTLGFPTIPSATAVGELTGDGIVDFAHFTNTTMRVYSAAGGVVTDTGIVVNHNQAAPVAAIGDLDGDGDADVVVSGSAQYTVLRRTGPAVFTVESPVSGGPVSLFSDVDGDGDADGLHCAGGSAMPSATYLLTNASTFRISINHNGILDPPIAFMGLGGSRIAGVADLDKDGRKDIVAGRCIYYNSGVFGQGNMITGQKVPLPFYNYNYRFIADFDGDGDPDLNLNSSSVLKNNGDGDFALSAIVKTTPPAGRAWNGSLTIDADGDGDVDLLVHDSAGVVFVGTRLLSNAGGGSFIDGGLAMDPGVPVDLFNSPAYAPEAYKSFTADIDNDGDVDFFYTSIVLVSPNWSTAARTFINQGGGFFVKSAIYGWVPSAAGDLNNDGMIDFAVCAGNNGAVVLGTGNSNFSAPVNLGRQVTKPGIDRIVAVDFDSDGDLDIAFTGYPSDTNTTPPSAHYFFTNDGSANFTLENPSAPRDVYYSSGEYRALAGDLNNDGGIDFMMNPTSGAIDGTAVFRNVGGIVSFTPSERPAIVPNALADMDGDGDLDCIISNLNSNFRIGWNQFYLTPQNGYRRQYGNSTFGLDGMPPTLGAKGPVRYGDICEIRLVGCVGEAGVAFVLGPAETAVLDWPLPGLVGYTYPWLATAEAYAGGTPGAPGEGSVSIPFVVPAELVGSTVYLQAYSFDASVPQLITATNGLLLTFGQP